MKGLSLSTFRLDLHKVEPDTTEPYHFVHGWVNKLEPWLQQLRSWYGNIDLLKRCHDIQFHMYANFSFDELCKIKHSSFLMMDTSVCEVFDKRAQYQIVQKIESSMWRWSHSSGTWNQVVDAYDYLRFFTFLDDPDFEIRLDWTTGYNERGYSKFSRTYLDGIFGILVYYKQKHVMTIGFSILDSRRVLIQQVQLANQKGNRWLFRLAKNRMEFVIDLFLRNFPGYKLYVVDGAALVEKSLRSYRHALESNHESRERWKTDEEYLKRLDSERVQLQALKGHLESDSPRLTDFYRNTGRFGLGTENLTTNGLTHYPVLVPA